MSCERRRQAAFAAIRRGELDLGAGQGQRGRDEVETGDRRRDDELGQCHRSDHRPVDRPLDERSLDPEAARGVALGVEVDDEDPFALRAEIGRKVDHRGGLPDAALLVGTGDRLAHQAPGRRVLTSVNSTIWRPFSLSRAGVRRGAADPDSRRSPDAHRRASWSPQTPCVGVARGTVQVRVTLDRACDMLAIARGMPAALHGALRACIGSTWNAALERRRLRPIGPRARPSTRPTSGRARPRRSSQDPQADGRMFHVQHAPAWKWPVSPIGTALGILLHDVAAARSSRSFAHPSSGRARGRGSTQQMRLTLAAAGAVVAALLQITSCRTSASATRNQTWSSCSPSRRRSPAVSRPDSSRHSSGA